MSTATLPMYEWKTIPWPKLQRNVFKLQKRIYQASQRGDTPVIGIAVPFFVKQGRDFVPSCKPVCLYPTLR